MNRIRNLIIATAILLVLLATMVTFRVPYNEAVIVTTFGSAEGEAGVRNGGTDAGLHFKAPWPIQNIARRYDTRLQVLETRFDQLTTADRQAVGVGANVYWKISDPLAFYNTLSNIPSADRQIRARLRAALAIVGSYRFNQLVNDNPDLLRREEIEQEMLAQMNAELSDEGIELVSVGIGRVVLGTTVTEAVFERMREEREADAVAARSEGDAQAGNIRAKAQSQADLIRDLANTRAAEIKAEGDAAAGALFPRFAANEEFAIFLQQVDMLPEMITENSTLILGPNNFSLLKMLAEDFDATQPLSEQTGIEQANAEGEGE
ncbi:MAG: protease modulator HflC [Planctomycetota bacterium]